MYDVEFAPVADAVTALALHTLKFPVFLSFAQKQIVFAAAFAIASRSIVVMRRFDDVFVVARVGPIDAQTALILPRTAFALALPRRSHRLSAAMERFRALLGLSIAVARAIAQLPARFGAVFRHLLRAFSVAAFGHI